MPGDPLYDTDFYAWTQDQASRIRQLSRHTGINVENVTEELETLGRWHRSVVEDHLKLALAYALVWAGDDNPNAAMRDDCTERGWTWFDEYVERVNVNLGEAPHWLEASMQDHIDLARIWPLAIRRANVICAQQRKPGFPIDLTCPVDLTSLLNADISGGQLRDRIAVVLR